MVLVANLNRWSVRLCVVFLLLMVHGSRAHRWMQEEREDNRGYDFAKQAGDDQGKNTEAEVLSSRHPGSRPPQCHNFCGRSCHGRCIARPRFLQGGRFGQHAVWTCSCQEL